MSAARPAAASPARTAPETARPSRGTFGRWLRTALYYPAFGAIFVAFEIALRAWAMPCRESRLGERARRFNVLIRGFGRAVTRLTETVLGASVEVRGVVPSGRFVVIANHQSAVDIAFLIDRLAPLNVKFVAKDTLGRRIPTVSTALRHGGAALISRSGGRDDLRALVTMARDLERWDGSALIFAEGTRARDGGVARFHVAGARVVLRESGLPLLPVCIEGTHVAADMSSLARGLLGARVVITIGVPVPAPVPAHRSGTGVAEALRSLEDWSGEVIEALRAEGVTARPTPPREDGSA